MDDEELFQIFTARDQGAAYVAYLAYLAATEKKDAEAAEHWWKIYQNRLWN